jgi:hypothetical protein
MFSGSMVGFERRTRRVMSADWPSSEIRRLNIEHITLPVFHDDGQLATREVLEVEPVAEHQYRLLHSPAYVEGIASGDVIELDSSLSHGFRLLSRADNLAVVVVFEKPEHKAAHAGRLEESIHTIGGVVDGGPARALVLTVPFSSGFQAVESVLTAFIQETPGATWWYGNVYEAGDPARPLNWWKDPK